MGGGHALFVNSALFNATRIDEIILPKQLESTNSIVWIKVMPKKKCDIKVIIVCGIYFKPHSKAKTLLNDHLVGNYHLLKSKYKNVRFVFTGDFNDFSPNILLSQSGQLRQMINYPTCGNNALEKLVTDLHAMYQPPLKINSLIPNSQDLGVPSDHCVNISFPRDDISTESKRVFKTINIRPITNSQLEAMGQFLVGVRYSLIKLLKKKYKLLMM